jgi:hypothetical protein
MEPEVVDIKNVTIEWNTPPDESGLIAFLVKEKGFSEERVRNGLEALKKARRTKPQGRLDSFFKPHPKTTPAPQFHASSASAATTTVASLHSNATHTDAKNATSTSNSTDDKSPTATSPPPPPISAAAATALKKRSAPSNTESTSKKVKK